MLYFLIFLASVWQSAREAEKCQRKISAQPLPQLLEHTEHLKLIAHRGCATWNLFPPNLSLTPVKIEVKHKLRAVTRAASKKEGLSNCCKAWSQGQLTGEGCCTLQCTPPSRVPPVLSTNEWEGTQKLAAWDHECPQGFPSHLRKLEVEKAEVPCLEFLNPIYMEVSFRGWCCLQMFCTRPVIQLLGPASSCHTGKRGFCHCLPTATPGRNSVAVLETLSSLGAFQTHS